MTILSTGEEEHCELKDYRGLFWQHPVIAGLFAAMLLSLAGIPLTAGFLGKFYVIAAGASSALWLPVFVLVVSSTIGVYYYLRVIVAIFSLSAGLSSDDGGRRETAPLNVPPEASFSLAALVVLLFVLGLYPTPFCALIRTISASLG